MPDFSLHATYEPLSLEKAQAEAWRCLLCEDAPCEQGCPAHVPVREFIRNIRSSNLRAAYHLIQSANIFAATCGRVCNSHETCQKRCTSNKLLNPIEIQKLQQFVCEQFVGVAPELSSKPGVNGQRVAVVGAGPSGLAAAYELCRHGIEVTVFEKEKSAGGVPHFSLPEYRLPQALLQKEIGWLKQVGVKVVTDHDVADINKFAAGFNALIIATGLGKNASFNIPGQQLKNVYSAKEILRTSKARAALALGNEVVVIGGGNSAIDAAITAKLVGAKNVTVVYRRGEEEMPAWRREIEIAKKIGVAFRYLAQPLEIIGSDKVIAVRCQLMRLLALVPGSQRRDVEPIKDAVFTIAADSVVLAIGEKADSEFFATNKIELNESHTTSNRKVFISGDLISAEKSVVHAVASGRECAQRVLEFLQVECIPVTKSSYYPRTKINLGVDFCGVRFEHPFILAAAPPTDDLEMVRAAFRKGWAGAVLKTTSVEQNQVPLKYPMMTGYRVHNKNIAGLGNIDLISEHHIDVIEARVKALKAEFPSKVVIASIMGATKEDWQQLVRRLEFAGVDIIECSFSCPQGTLGSKPGFMLGQDPMLVEKVAGWVKEAAARVPVVIKITPQVADIIEVARAVKKSGADAICASNSVPALMGINLSNFVPYPNVGNKSTYSGFTGPAIKPLTLRTIAEIKKHVDLPVTGTGGPSSWSDAIELMAVGATTVQFCTAVMHYGFDIIDDLLSGLYYFMREKGFTTVEQIVGRSLPFITTHDELRQATKIVSAIDRQKCIGCGECYVACRDGGHQAILFNQENRQFSTDETKCVGCAFCTYVCPVADCLQLKNL